MHPDVTTVIRISLDSAIVDVVLMNAVVGVAFQFVTVWFRTAVQLFVHVTPQPNDVNVDKVIHGT